jgi:CheY-like chemotaxis protein
MPTQSTARSGGVSVLLRVLVADDNEINQMVACELLLHMGHQVDTAADGAQAVARAAAQAYDLILMDLSMPGLDGRAAARAIRAAERNGGGRACIVALTARSLAEVSDSDIEGDFDAYLAKPLRPGQDLDAVLAQAGGRGTCGRAPTAVRLKGGDATAGWGVGSDAWETLVQLTAHGGLSLPRYVRILLEDAPPRLAHLRAAVEAGDAATVELEAHTLKSGAREFGATRLVALCQELEDLGRGGGGPAAAALLAQIEWAWPRLRDDLVVHLQRWAAAQEAPS